MQNTWDQLLFFYIFGANAEVQTAGVHTRIRRGWTAGEGGDKVVQ